MKLLVALLVVLVVAAIVTTQARAATTSQKLHKSTTVVAWYKGEGWWHLRPGFRKCGDIRWDRPAARCWRHRANLRWHRARVVRLTPRPQATGHVAGWLCIHSREGAWNAQTGNGYYGGLQMSYGWMGLVGNAALLSPEQQMAAAETGYRQSGYSSAWLAGQWPNTYPPCAGYF